MGLSSLASARSQDEESPLSLPAQGMGCMPGKGGCDMVGGSMTGGIGGGPTAGTGMGGGGGGRGCSGVKRGCSRGCDDSAKQLRRTAADDDDAEPTDSWS